MNLELATKLITIAGGVFALYKVIAELVISKKPRLREEFKFIKEFIAELTPTTHPFVIEKGYLAITGDATLKSAEITYLLSLPAPGHALKKYSAARKYLQFNDAAAANGPRVTFRKKYTKNKRRRIKNWNLVGYFVFATLAFSPLPFAKEIFGTNWQAGLIVISMAILSFIPLAFSSLTEFGRVLRGEELVAMQTSTSEAPATESAQENNLPECASKTDTDDRKT